MNEQMRLHTGAQVASLVLANAMIFHAELALVDPRVRTLRPLLDERDPRGQLIKHWRFIRDNINYVPIFLIAERVVMEMPERRESDTALKVLADAVTEISANRAALRHDLMGRIYHTLLLEAKYLGTYYTSVPAATLLLKVALHPARWQMSWPDLETLRKFRVADLACGTGTLLMAAQQALTDNFVSAYVARGGRMKPEIAQDLHRALVEEVIHGYDVLASAVHLTASTLAILAPEIAFSTMNLFCLPLGVSESSDVALGSIDYVVSSKLALQLNLMGEQEVESTKVTGQGDVHGLAPLPILDLCVMNPPFTRSVGGNLLFGSLPKTERQIMQKRLRQVVSGTPLQASSTAGLGSVFVAVADRYMKPQGRLALVLPLAVGSGVAWEPTRRLLADHYVIETVITSHDPERWNFSDSTDLSEVLLVARRKANDESDDQARTVFVNLWKNTPSVARALSVASRINREQPAEIEKPFGVCPIDPGDRHTWGEMLSVPWSAIKNDQWYPSAFAQTDLNRTAHHLRNGCLLLPTKSKLHELPLTALSSLGQLGPDRRDVYDGFRLSKSPTAYPAFWGHDASQVVSLAAQPNMNLQPLHRPRKDRKLRSVELVWSRAGRIMLAERMRLNTQRVVAMRLTETALSNVWWPFEFHSSDEILEKALILWLNCTIGLVSTLSHRVPTQGAWIQFKKPILEQMPVLDLWRLEPEQIKSLAKTYEKLCSETLLPLPEMAHDPIRAEMDACISEVMGLPPLDRLRAALAREPVISLKQLWV
ncbi:hypothetical protein EHM69_05790 [candidate division KSB1 bacterium]|nr:MAG: hypothetical protein EHM69_05790 [candidate division KSB1 bacterium]